MKLQILGTAAAEGWPALYCACETCHRARLSGGKDLRSRASMMVNDVIKIDLNADTYHHIATHGIDLSKLEHILFTHSHNDHMLPGELGYLRSPFAHNRSVEKIGIWASSQVNDIIRATYPDPDKAGVELHDVTPFTSINVSGLKATPIIAVHKEGEVCLNWILGEPDNAVLYTSDTGPYREETWKFLAGVKFDLVISECTCGFLMDDPGTHMSVNTVRHLRNTLDTMGSLKPDCRFVITHFSHNIALLHEELEAKVKDDGFIVAYDGILLEGGT